MIYKVIQPSFKLQDFVKNYLLLHYVFDKNEPTPVKPFPDGRCNNNICNSIRHLFGRPIINLVIFDLHHQFLNWALVAGVHFANSSALQSLIRSYL